MSNSFGHLFKITTFGESHGAAIGVVIDGCPSGLELDTAMIARDLERRRPGKTPISSQRQEKDAFQILSGLFEGRTTGAPICLLIPNRDARSKDYDQLEKIFRPSHADYSYQAKYGIRDHRGGGRASARETACRVAAGAIAKQFLAANTDIQIEAWVQSIHTISWQGIPSRQTPTEYTEATGCPDPDTALHMYQAIDRARKDGDSLGGVIACRVLHTPAGLGEPVYAKLSARLGEAMLGINAVKGFEIGAGFAATRMMGSEHNDPFVMEGENIRTSSNFSGGVQGGISNGMPIEFRVAFKPTATIMRPQQSVDMDGNAVTLEPKGRHDPCVVPRAVPIVEAMAALVLADAWLLHNAYA